MQFDLLKIFSEQLSKVKPYTAGNVKSALSLMAKSKPLRELVQQSKLLKSKVGLKRLEYVAVVKTKSQTHRVWEDELDELNKELIGYSHVGYVENKPVFELSKP